MLPCQHSSVTSVDGSGCLTSWGQCPVEGVLVEEEVTLRPRAQGVSVVAALVLQGCALIVEDVVSDALGTQ